MKDDHQSDAAKWTGYTIALVVLVPFAAVFFVAVFAFHLVLYTVIGLALGGFLLGR